MTLLHEFSTNLLNGFYPPKSGVKIGRNFPPFSNWSFSTTFGLFFLSRGKFR